MTGRDLKALRFAAGMSLTEFARALGYEGSDDNENRRIRRFENMGRLPEAVALRAQAVEMEVTVARLRAARKAIGGR